MGYPLYDLNTLQYTIFFLKKKKKKICKFHVKVLKEITNKILLDYKNFITKLKEKKKCIYPEK